MAFICADRVMESSTTTGTGALTLAGAYTGYRRFSAVMSTSDTCKYVIEAIDANGNPTGDWEVGIGTYSGTNQLTRTTVEASSNANAAVTLSAGTKRVMLDASAALLNSFLKNSNNLSDVSSVSTARSNLDVYATASTDALAAQACPPKGRLTLVTGVPVMTSDQTAKSTVYYTPYNGDRIPIYSGSAWTFKTFAELSLNLDTSNQLLDNIYDVFVWNNSGTISIGAGPAWNYNSTVTMTIATPAVVTWTAHGLNEGDPIVFTTSGALPTGVTAGTTYFVSRAPAANTFNISTTRANAVAGTLIATSGSQSGTHTGTVNVRQRGTGAGTTELELKDGIWTNKNSITLKNGAGAGTSGIAANTATYVGSIYCTANGQTGMAFKPTPASGGTNNFLGVWNAHNRVLAVAMSRDSTASWNYAVTTWRASNASAGNRISYIDGLAESATVATLNQSTSNTSSSGGAFGVNRDSTSSTPTTAAQMGQATTAGLYTVNQREVFTPSLGLHYVTGMEIRLAGTQTMNGLQSTDQYMHSVVAELLM